MKIQLYPNGPGQSGYSWMVIRIFFYSAVQGFKTLDWAEVYTSNLSKVILDCIE